MTTITPFLWFDDGQIAEALDLYASIFPDVVVHSLGRGPDGNVLTADFSIAGQALKALNGGPQFPFTEAVSLFVEVDGQAEVDHLWDAIIASGGEEGRCGWCKDRFGLSWQIVPRQFGELVSTGTPEQIAATFAAMMTMSRMDVAALQAAHDGA